MSSEVVNPLQTNDKEFEEEKDLECNDSHPTNEQPQETSPSINPIMDAAAPRFGQSPDERALEAAIAYATTPTTSSSECSSNIKALSFMIWISVLIFILLATQVLS